jgi:replication factor A1
MENLSSFNLLFVSSLVSFCLFSHFFPPVIKIADLEPDSHGHNLKVLVTEVKTVLDRPRFDGSRLRVAEATIGDETGSVLFTARNGERFLCLKLSLIFLKLEQIDFFTVGQSLIIRNAKVEMFRNHMRLVVDKWGLVEVSEKKYDFKVDSTRNLSLVEYELIEVKDGAE